MVFVAVARRKVRLVLHYTAYGRSVDVPSHVTEVSSRFGGLATVLTQPLQQTSKPAQQRQDGFKEIGRRIVRKPEHEDGAHLRGQRLYRSTAAPLHGE